MKRRWRTRYRRIGQIGTVSGLRIGGLLALVTVWCTAMIYRSLKPIRQWHHPLVVPVGKKIRIITTANDVIHAWMVPAFGVKQDAIPGFVRDTWFRANKTGDFYGQCAELCGKEHAYMPIHVKVLSQADYTAWVQREVNMWTRLVREAGIKAQ